MKRLTAEQKLVEREIARGIEHDVHLFAPLPKTRVRLVPAEWRERALAAEALVRAKDETIGELLNVLGFASDDPREMLA